MNRRSRHLRRFVPTLRRHAFLVLLVVFALGPLVVMVFNALKPISELGFNPLGPPSQLALSNIGDAWARGKFSTTLPNSVALVLLTLGLGVPIAALAAFGLSRPRIAGASVLIVYLLVASTIPLQLFLVPLFFVWSKLSATSSLPGLAVIYVAILTPFAVFLIRSYMVKIPRDFEEAARVDGAGDLQVLWHVVVPMAWPGILAASLIMALSVWQEYLLATVFLLDPDTFTVVTSFYQFQTQFSTDWTLESAAALITIVPVVVIFLALQRRFIGGLTQGGLTST